MSVEPVSETDPKPLSAGKTAAWGLAILLVSGFVRTAAITITAKLRGGAATTAAAPGDRSDGLLFAIAIIAAASAGFAALWFALRRHQPRRYLNVTVPKPAVWALWVLATLALDFALDGLMIALHHERVPAEWVAAYRSAGWAPFLVVAVAVVGPIFEELYFRGFLHRGLVATRLRPAGTIALTTVLFTLAHFPSDLVTFLGSASAGLILGVARQHSGSTLTTMSMHMAGNMKTMLAVAMAAR